MTRSAVPLGRLHRFIQGRQRLLLSIVAGIVVFAVIPETMRLNTRILIAWDVIASLYIAATIKMIWSSNVDRQLQRYEAGSNRAIATRLYDFARLLDAAPGYFFEGYGDPSEKTAGSGSPHDQATLAMVHSSHEVQTLLIAYLKVESRRLREDILRMILDLEGM